MFTFLLFIIILSILVSVHELGHFIAARKSGMRVYEFGIGFPPRAIGVYRDPVTKKIVWVRNRTSEEFPATVYSLNWLPLGGFCKIKGENGDEATASDSFSAQKAWKRIIVLVAGVAMNILLAAVLFAGGLMIGLPTDVSEGVDERAVLVSPPSVVVEEVVKGSPAELAGVQFGDKVSAIDGQEMKSAADFIDYVSRHPDQELNLTVDRGGSEVDLPPAKPIVLAGGGDMPRLGVRLGDAAIVRYPWYLAIPKGFAAAGIGLVNIYISFYLLLKNLILGNGLIFDVSGPVGIASVVGASARLGLSYLIQVTAMISLSLAAINILPIPALDGGRALFVIIEKIFRRPVPMRYEQLAHTIGFVLLIILIVVVTWRDVAGLVR
ncbi:MAG: RIP metalloprotease RseP [Patescibacteria group bacterium]